MKRPTPYAIEQGYNHAEAFALMPYLCAVCRGLEWLWNSRDGITPLSISCVHDLCNEVNHFGCPMTHNMGFDVFALPGKPLRSEDLSLLMKKHPGGYFHLAETLKTKKSQLVEMTFLNPPDGMRIFTDMSLEHAAQIAESRMLSAPESLPHQIQTAYFETSPNGDLSILQHNKLWVEKRNDIAKEMARFDDASIEQAKAGGFKPGGAPAIVTWPIGS